MIISYTKDLAILFDLKLNVTATEKFESIPILDDWVMACLWNTPEHIALTLIHQRSLFSLIVISEVKDMPYCISLFNKQLNALLDEVNLSDKKYKEPFENLFKHILVVKHDDKGINNAIKHVRDHFSIHESRCIHNGLKIKSIDIVNFANNRVRKKLDFRKASEVFYGLVRKHYNDPIIVPIPNDTEIIKPTFH